MQAWHLQLFDPSLALRSQHPAPSSTHALQTDYLGFVLCTWKGSGIFEQGSGGPRRGFPSTSRGS